MMACPRITSGPRKPMSASHSIGVRPLRRTISWNSLTDWLTWIWIGTLRSLAAARVSRSSASVQVSTWTGLRNPLTRPSPAPSYCSMNWIGALQARPARPPRPTRRRTWRPSGVYQRPGAVARPHVEAEAGLDGPLDGVLRQRPDLQDGGGAAVQQLGHRVVDAGPRGVLVLGRAAHRQELEQARVVELAPPRSSMNDLSSGEPARWAWVLIRPGVTSIRAGVDRLVGGAVVRGADVDDLLPLDHDHAIA